MKLKFNREVRKSIADELKKVSTFGGIGLGVLGYSINAAASFVERVFMVDRLPSNCDDPSCYGG